MDPIRRIDYQSGPLLETDFADNPLAQFQRWLGEANAAGIEEPNAMAMASTDAHGQPQVRTMLCKEVTAEGFVFYTNYRSDKAAQIEQNPQVGLCFHWQPVHRQVRVVGIAGQVPAAESDEYFASRPREAQLGAWTSPQSRVIPDRDYLRTRLEEIAQRYPDEVPRPAHWGGYVVVPKSVEFWQGQPSRLHDRLRYSRRDDGLLNDPKAWRVERLAP
ncbi:MAG: pyridoxamine 5'-phosphate oxidase [Candidatus Nanopelagicales bacterium]